MIISVLKLGVWPCLIFNSAKPRVPSVHCRLMLLFIYISVILFSGCQTLNDANDGGFTKFGQISDGDSADSHTVKNAKEGSQGRLKTNEQASPKTEDKELLSRITSAECDELISNFKNAVQARGFKVTEQKTPVGLLVFGVKQDTGQDIDTMLGIFTAGFLAGELSNNTGRESIFFVCRNEGDYYDGLIVK